MSQPLTVHPGSPFRFKDFDAGYTGDVKDKAKALEELQENVACLGDLGYRLYAENRRALLLILQGMDTSGKDGAIRKVMQGFNAQSCTVVPFKRPSDEELAHDFLWRIAKAVPRKGHVGIFNRSHYEDVLVVRVHNLVPKAEWKTRYERINQFEELLVEGGVTVVKVFLHISKAQQCKRLQARLDNPAKRWKFEAADLKERGFWRQYREAYEAAVTCCNTKHAPWYIVPADHKWYRNLVLSRILRRTLEEMNPQYPPPQPGLDELVVK